MTQIQDAYVVSAVRAPVAKARGQFKHYAPDSLLSDVLRALVAKTPDLDLQAIDDVIIGCAMPEAEQGMNIARIASLLAGLPDCVSAMTINRFCSSGLQSIATAAQTIQLGVSDLMIAGGVESMSMIPMGGHHFVANPAFFSDDEAHADIALGMGMTAERVASRWKIDRDSQDQFALTSHERAIAARDAGFFKDEIVPITLTTNYPDLATQVMTEKVSVVTDDEGPRADTSLAALAKLRTVFAARGSVTAGNSSQMSDGAGAVLLASEAAVKRYQLTPLARFVGFTVAGVAPDVMGIGPVAAIPKLLKQTGLQLQQMDWIELNEAFAAQSLAVINELDLDPQKVNPQGGAIALGHPLGATGAIRTATCLHGLKRTQGRYGLVTMCIGTGMGAAGIFEVC